jgi:hypothetical protein
VRAGLGQRQQAQLGEAAGAARCRGTAEALLERRGIGQVDGGAVQADQPAAAIPGTWRLGRGERARHAGERLFQRGGAETGSRLGDGRLVGQGRLGSLQA